MANGSSAAIPIIIITVGVGWLLSTLGVAPNINWVWTLGLAVGGILAFAISGFDKATVVIGPLLLLASILSVLRQSGRLHVDVEVPILVIASGILLFVAQSTAVPPPKWLAEAMLENRPPDKDR